MKEFQVGDKVYFPTLDSKVHLLVETTGANYKLGLPFTETTFTFTLKGQWRLSDHVPAIFHATQENKIMLDALYGVEFETPPPSTVSVTLEVPEPFEPKLNEIYWYLNVCGNFDMHVFQNDSVDKSILFKWQTEGEARQALKTLNATFGMAL